jgi:hypothetical protein
MVQSMNAFARFTKRILSAWLAVLACTGVASAVDAGHKSSATVAYLGEWEVTRVLMTAGMQPQWSMRENDPRLLGRRLWISSDYLVFQSSAEADRRDNCKLHAPTKASANIALGKLFSGSLREGTRAKVVGSYVGRLYGREKNFDHSALRSKSVALMRISCTAKDHPWVANHNWIAKPNGSDDVLLWAFAPDALMVFERPRKNTVLTQEQKSFCDQATSASDKAICSNAQLVTLYRLIHEAPKDYAKTPVEEVNALRRKNIATLIEKRAICNGDLVCLYDVLDKHLTTLVQWQ